MKQIITAPSGATIEVIQLVEGDGMFNPRVWDAVAEFLGLDPNNGRGESFTMRRPPAYRGGSVEVTLHQNWGSGQQGTAQHNDWLVKFPGDKVFMLDPGAFAIVFGTHYARERCPTCGSLDPVHRGRDTSTQRLDLCRDRWHDAATSMLDDEARRWEAEMGVPR